MPADDPISIAVCGPDPVPTADVEREAEEIGRRIAEAGAVLVCGGLGGVMDAAARGCVRGSGMSIGILPSATRTGASPALTYSVPTGIGEMRNALIVRAADALIAVSGGFGTLSEIAFALKTGVPVVGLRTWGLVRDGAPVEAFVRVDSPEEAVREALRLARERRAEAGQA